MCGASLAASDANPRICRRSALPRLRPAASVDCALELLDEAEALLVGEGEDLGEDDAGQVGLGVDPVVGVGQAGPGQAATAAAGWGLLGGDHVAEAPLLDH